MFAQLTLRLRLLVAVVAIAGLLGAYVLIREPAEDGSEPRPVAPAARASHAAAAASGQPPEPQPAPGATGAASASQTDKALASNTEEWIDRLPLSAQSKARRFVERNAPAFDFDRPEILAWMRAHGFPSLEEVAAFDFASASRICTTLECHDARIAALAADHLLATIEERIPAHALADGVDVREFLASPSPLDRKELNLVMIDAHGYINQARNKGSTIFAAYLEARWASLFGREAEVRIARAVAAACGDRRLRDTPSSREVWLALSMVPGAPQACGIRPGMPLYPQ